MNIEIPEKAVLLIEECKKLHDLTAANEKKWFDQVSVLPGVEANHKNLTIRWTDIPERDSEEWDKTYDDPDWKTEFYGFMEFDHEWREEEEQRFDTLTKNVDELCKVLRSLIPDDIKIRKHLYEYILDSISEGADLK